MSSTGDVPFAARVERFADHVVVAVSGEVDIATADEFWAGIASAASMDLPVVIDLTETSFMDSSGLAVLVRAHRRTEEVGVPLTVTTSPGAVRKVLALSGLTKRLNVDIAGPCSFSVDAGASEPSSSLSAP